MKFLLSIAIAGGLLDAQTKPNLAAAKGPPAIAATTAVLIGPGGTIQFVTLDPTTLQIVNGVLSAAPAKLPARIVEVTQVALQTPTYTLGQAPNAAPELDIFLNGICLSVGVDYSVAGNVATFINGVLPGPTDVLRVVYRGA